MTRFNWKLLIGWKRPTRRRSNLPLRAHYTRTHPEHTSPVGDNARHLVAKTSTKYESHSSTTQGHLWSRNINGISFQMTLQRSLDEIASRTGRAPFIFLLQIKKEGRTTQAPPPSPRGKMKATTRLQKVTPIYFWYKIRGRVRYLLKKRKGQRKNLFSPEITPTGRCKLKVEWEGSEEERWMRRRHVPSSLQTFVTYRPLSTLSKS